MTRPCHTHIQCPICRSLITIETGFGRWIRERRDLGSVKIGLAVNDVDFSVHRYKTDAWGRDLQLFMEIEVKTHGAEPSKSQSDTLVLKDQLLNNRKNTPTKINAKSQASYAIRRAYSLQHKKVITVWSFGCYLLQFEQIGPDDSQWIKWGKRRTIITEDQLAALLRFDLDPDTLQPLDLRSHHRRPSVPLLENMPEKWR